MTGKTVKGEITKKQKAIGLVIGGLIFIVGIPFILIVVSSYIDARLNLRHPVPEPFNLDIAIILIVLGLLLVAWSGFVQLKVGRGTPIPKVPTQRLVITGPYRLCRNPMLLGSVIYYLGISSWLNSLSAMMLTALFLLLSVVYIKLVEEKELEARFGEDYREYKRRTSFLIPRPNEYIRDILILCLVGLIAIECLSIVLGFAISLTVFNAWQDLKGFPLSSILHYLKYNPLIVGVAILVNHVINAILRLSITLHYDKKYGIFWKDLAFDPRNIVSILAVVVFLEVILFPILSGELPYEPQIVCEYRWFSKLGTGLIGYAMQFLYYIAEGIWIASILEIGSKRWNYGGLVLLLIFWTPWHLFRLNGIDVLNFVWAVITAFVLEWCRRKGCIVAVVLVWLLILVL